MTSAQLILVSVSSALIAVIAMLVVATVLRARTRESTGGEVSPATGPQTRAQRAAARAQKKAQKATTKAERKAAKATASVAKAEKDKAAALAVVTTKPTDGKPLPSGGDPSKKSEKDDKGERVVDTKSDASAAGDSTGETDGSSAGASTTTADETDVLAVPAKKPEKDDEVATTEAGKKASEAKPKARKSLLGRTRSTDDAPEKKS